MRRRTGWSVAFAVMIALIPSSSAIGISSQGYFLGPVIKEFGWTRAEFMSALSFSYIASAFLMSIVGYIADRVGIRPVLLCGVVVFGLGTMALALIPGSLVMYYALTFLVIVAAIVQTPMLYAKAISGWVDRNRGLALGVGLSGNAIGGLLLPPFTAWLVTEYGWRVARVGLGAAILLLAIPAVLFFIREPLRASRPAGSGAAEPKLGLRHLIRNRTFLLICAAIGLSGPALAGAVSHMIPILTDHGLSLKMATACLSIMAISQWFGRLASGWLLDRVQTPKIGLLWFGIAMLAIVVVGTSHEMIFVAPAAAMLGAAMGAESELGAYFSGRYFGLARFGEIYGLVLTTYTLGVGFGGLIYAFSYERMHTYWGAVAFAVGLLVICCLAILRLPPYVYPREGRLTK